MATPVNRSIAECTQRVVDPAAEVAQLDQAFEYYRSKVSSDDPDGTMAYAFEARRLHRIRAAITPR